MANADIKTELKEMKELLEISIQQKSGHQSVLLKRIDDIEKNQIESMKWQTNHEQLDVERFNVLPSKEDISETVRTAVKVQVNGEFVHMNEKFDRNNSEVIKHLSEQDKSIADLGAKIKPIDTTRSWFVTFFKGLIYIGGIGIAIGGIVSLIALIFSHK